MTGSGLWKHGVYGVTIGNVAKSVGDAMHLGSPGLQVFVCRPIDHKCP